MNLRSGGVNRCSHIGSVDVRRESGLLYHRPSWFLSLMLHTARVACQPLEMGDELPSNHSRTTDISYRIMDIRVALTVHWGPVPWGQEKFIADVLASSSDKKLADILAECVPTNPDNANLLAKYLEKSWSRWSTCTTSCPQRRKSRRVTSKPWSASSASSSKPLWTPTARASSRFWKSSRIQGNQVRVMRR